MDPWSYPCRRTVRSHGIISGQELRHRGYDAMTTGWKRLGKVLLKHNVPAVCQCGYRARLDSLLRCAGLGGVNAVDNISDESEPNVYVPYTGDEAMFRLVHDAEIDGQVFDRGTELMRKFERMGMGSQADTVAEVRRRSPSRSTISRQRDCILWVTIRLRHTLLPIGQGMFRQSPSRSFLDSPHSMPPLDDPIARQEYLFTQPESRQTMVFDPGVQQTSEIEEVRDKPVQSADVQAEDSTDTTDSGDTDETPLSRGGRGFRKKKQRKMYDL